MSTLCNFRNDDGDLLLDAATHCDTNVELYGQVIDGRYRLTGIYLAGSIVNLIDWLTPQEITTFETHLTETLGDPAEAAAWDRADSARDARADAILT